MSATKSLSIMELNQAEQPKKSFLKTLGNVIHETAKVVVAIAPFVIEVFSKLNDEDKGAFLGGVAKEIKEDGLIKKATN